MNFNRSEQYAIVAVLIAIIEADGVIHPNEIAYLNRILASFSITESEIEELPPFDPYITPNILKGMEENKKKEAKELFIGMAKCDGYAHKNELEIIDRLYL